ncbi:MAG: GAF domain-containing protein [Anaerolineae bacterium]|nr:GAF domain-containing protein [Anaerolineae bacterium]
MPKKKPIAKRLDKLFDDIKHEEPGAEAKPRSRKRVSEEKGQSTPQPKATVKKARAFDQAPSNVIRTDTALSLAFQLGQSNWATLQVVDETDTRNWTDEEQLLVKQVADQLSLALENARLFQETQRRAQEMTALAEVGREVSATLNLETVLERIAEYAKDLLQAESSAVYLPSPDSKAWQAISVVGEDAEEIKNDPIKSGRGILGKIAVDKVGRIVNSASNEAGAVTVAGTNVHDYEHIMGTPILIQDRVTGLMAVWRTGEGLEFNQTELEFLNSLAQQAAIAIENARLFKSVTDSQGQLAEALRIGRMGYFEYDLPNGVLTLTDEMLALVGSSAEKEGGNKFPLREILKKYVIAEDVQPTLATISDLIKHPEKKKLSQEIRFKTLDGKIIWVEVIYSIEMDSSGRYSKVVGSSQDITERKINELTQSAITHISESALTSKTVEELFQAVHDSIQTLLPARNFYVALYDRSTNEITFPYHVDEIDDDWSPRGLGRGLTSHVIRTGKPLRTTPEIFSELEASGEIVSDGIRSVDWLGVPLRSGGVVRGVMAVQTYDASVRITENQVESFSLIGAQTAAAFERLQAREELAKSEADLRALFAAMEDVILVYDKEGRYVRIAPTNPSRLFLPPEDMIGKKITEVLPKELQQPFMDAIQQTITSGQTTKIEYPLDLNDQIYWFDATLSKLNEDQVFWVARDITERKLAEEALQRRNTYLAASSEIGRLVTSTLDLNSIFTRTVSLISERFGFYFASLYSTQDDEYYAILREATGEAGEKMKSLNHRVVIGSQTIIGQAAGTGEVVIANDVTTEP